MSLMISSQIFTCAQRRFSKDGMTVVAVAAYICFGFGRETVNPFIFYG